MVHLDELIPPGISVDDWDAAHRRVWAYLAALGVRHEFLLHRHVQDVMARCATRMAADSRLDALQAATDEVDRTVLAWFRAVLGAAGVVIRDEDLGSLSLRGRLAMLLVDLPRHWAGVFLADPPWPADFVKAVRACYIEGVPAMRLGHMTGPPLELGLVPQLADKALQTIDHTRWLRIVLLWGGFAVLFLFIFWFTR